MLKRFWYQGYYRQQNFFSVRRKYKIIKYEPFSAIDNIFIVTGYGDDAINRRAESEIRWQKTFLISVQSSEKPLANWPKGQVERSIGISSNGCFAPNLRFFIGQKEYLSISSGISQIDIWRFNLTKIIWLFISVTFFCRGTISNFVRMIIIYCSVNTVAAIKFFKG